MSVDPAGARAERLVERERELAAVDAALDAAVAGTGCALLVEGGAGLGKSRLLRAATERGRARSMQVLRARALEPEREFSFAVALQLLEAPVADAAPDEREALLAGAAGLACGLLSGASAEDPLNGGPAEGPSGARSPFSILHGLYWTLVNLTRSGAVALCVDDMHWGDDASLRFLLYLTARLDELPVALLVAARPPATGGEPAAVTTLRDALRDRRIGLRALAAAGVASVVRSSLPRAEASFCAVCAEVTGGNPFRLGELLLAVDQDGVSPTAESVERVRVLGGALLGQAAVFRLMRLGPDAITLARAVAVLGDGAPLHRAAALAPLELDAAARAADALVGAEILASAQPPTFAHPLTRAEIYAEAPSAQQGMAHLRAARLLIDEGAAPELVAAQLLAAPPSGAGWVVDALIEAAARSRARGAPESAARYLARAWREPPATDRRADVLARLGAAEAAAGVDGAVEHLTEALALETDRAARAASARRLGQALGGLGRSAEAADVLERALDELGEDDGELNCAVLADYLTSAVFVPGLRQRAVARAGPLLRDVPSGTTAAQRSLLAAAAMRSGQRGEPAAATIELAQRAWSDGALLHDDGPDGPGWLLVDWALELAEDYAGATAVTEATIQAARRVGSPHAFADASYYHGDACLRQGRLSDAQADAEQAIETARTGWRRFLLGAIVVKANVLIERGEFQDATQLLAGAEDHERGTMLDVAWRLHARGRLELATGRAPQALEHFEAAGRWLADRLAAEHTVLPWRADAARAALAVGDRERARELVEPVLAHAERAGLRVMCGRRLRVLGLIEGGELGIELLQRAADTLSTSQAALEHAHALAELGSALRRARRRGDARLPLRQALDLAHRLGAGALADRARHELVAAGARPRRDPIAGADALTPSERRVAELAAQGLTNPRIAQALFVTPKTVEFHLRHVYQKLAIDGRTALPAALQRPSVGAT